MAAWATAAVLIGLALPGGAFAAQAPITGTQYVREGTLRFALPTEPNDEVYLESCLTSCNSPGQAPDKFVVVTGYEHVTAGPVFCDARTFKATADQQPVAAYIEGYSSTIWDFDCCEEEGKISVHRPAREAVFAPGAGEIQAGGDRLHLAQ